MDPRVSYHILYRGYADSLKKHEKGVWLYIQLLKRGVVTYVRHFEWKNYLDM